LCEESFILGVLRLRNAGIKKEADGKINTLRALQFRKEVRECHRSGKSGKKEIAMKTPAQSVKFSILT